MESSDSLGGRLRAERERLGLSQSEVASAAAAAGARGSTRQSQALYEKDERLPDAGYLAAVSRLGVDVRWVVTGYRDYQPQEPLTAEEQTAISYWRKASPETRRAALGALVGAVPTGAPSVVVKGSVGQHIHGDQHITGNGLQFGNVHPPPAPKPPRKR